VPAASSAHAFGSFRLDSAERLLLRGGEQISLTPKAFDLLVYLVEHAGRLVTKQELMNALWPDTFVEDSNLTFTVSALRKALGDNQAGAQYIQTVHTRGYRFVAPVTHEENTRVPTATETKAPGIRPRVGRLAIVGLLVGLIALVPLVVRHLRPTTSHVAARFTIPLPDSTVATYAEPNPQVSPDGRRVAILVASGGRIWLRKTDEQASHAIAGTENANGLFWAPDSQQLGFTTPSAVKKLMLSDGVVHTLCDPCQPVAGGTWSRSGTIVFPTVQGSLLAISAAGGETKPVTSVDRATGEIAHVSPHFLPDGRRFLFVMVNNDGSRSGLYVGGIDAAAPRLLLRGAVPAIYASPGYLLFYRARTLLAQAFDLKRLELTGEPRPLVAAEFATNQAVGQPKFSASDTGMLTYSIRERPLTQFQWVSRSGEPQQLVGNPGAYYTFDLSKDGSRLVYGRTEGGRTILWVHDLERNVPSRLTSITSNYADPRWTDRGDVVATGWEPGPAAIVLISSDGRESTIVKSAVNNMVESVSRDGQQLLYRQRALQLLARPLNDGSKPVVVRELGTGGMNQAQFSPDTRWIVFHERDESGKYEVWVIPNRPRGERRQVSSGGGVQPIWRQDGRELFYLGMDGALYAVEVRPGNRPWFSAPKRLFTTGLAPPALSVEEYAASRDGRRFLLLRPIEDRVRTSIGVIPNWLAQLTAAASK
jgi:eukaryotic-like serine/threonine-protein kinase